MTPRDDRACRPLYHCVPPPPCALRLAWPPPPHSSTLIVVSPKFAELRNEALRLPEEERAQLVEELQESLQHGDGWPDDLHPAWREEIVRRVQALERGEAELVDGEEALRRLRAKYAR